MQVRTVRCESSITERSVLTEDTHRGLPIVSNEMLVCFTENMGWQVEEPMSS